MGFADYLICNRIVIVKARRWCSQWWCSGSHRVTRIEIIILCHEKGTIFGEGWDLRIFFAAGQSKHVFIALVQLVCPTRAFSVEIKWRERRLMRPTWVHHSPNPKRKIYLIPNPLLERCSLRMYRPSFFQSLFSFHERECCRIRNHRFAISKLADK